MSDHDSEQHRADGGAFSHFDTAIALGRQREELLETARALAAEERAPGAERHAALRLQVTQFTRTLRAGGAAPERVLALVEGRHRAGARRATDGCREIPSEVVRWSVEAYYVA